MSTDNDEYVAESKRLIREVLPGYEENPTTRLTFESDGQSDEDMMFATFRPATDEEIEEVRRDEIAWSEGEKWMLSRCVQPERRLTYENGEPVQIQRASTRNGHLVNLYLFNSDLAKMAAIRRLWPFDGVPGPTDIRRDVHSDRHQRIADCRIIRWCRMNLIVAEDYMRTGGMAVDLIEDPNSRNGSSLCVSDVYVKFVDKAAGREDKSLVADIIKSREGVKK